MTYMKVDIVNIRSVNSSLPSSVNKVTNAKTGVGLLRNSIDSSIQNRQNIYNNIRSTYTSLETIEFKLSTLYNKINEFMTQYSQTDDILDQQSQPLISQINQITAQTSALGNQSFYEELKRLFDEDLIVKNHDIATNNITDVAGVSPIVSYVTNNENYMGFYSFNYFATFSSNRNTLIDALIISANDTLGEVKELIKGSTYRRKVIKDSLGEILKNLSDNSIKGDKIPDEVKDLVKVIKMGKDIKKFEKFQPLFEAYDKIGDAIDLTNFSVEQLEFWFNDYSTNLDYLNSLKTALISSGASDADIEAVIDDLRITYTYKWLGTLRDVTYEVFDKLTDKIVSSGVDLFTGGLYSVVDLGKDIAMEITNMDDLGDNLINLYALENYKKNLTSSYEYYKEIIKNNNYSENDVIQCQKMFDLSKAVILKEYNLMYDISNDKEERALLTSEIKKVKQMSYLPNSVSGGGFGGGGHRF